MSKILCTICARGGSKGVKSKNTRPLHGKPLIHHTIEQARASNIFTHIVVNSDSDDILSIASQIDGIELVKRPPEWANDTVSKRPAIRQSVLEIEKKYSTSCDIVIDLDCTSPLRHISDIAQALQQFEENNNDNLITAMPARRSPYFNMVKTTENGEVTLVQKLDKSITCRQDAPPVYDMNASVYIWKRNILFETDELFLKKTGLYVMPEERSIDIDTEMDFKIVEILMAEKTS